MSTNRSQILSLEQIVIWLKTEWKKIGEDVNHVSEFIRDLINGNILEHIEKDSASGAILHALVSENPDMDNVSRKLLAKASIDANMLAQIMQVINDIMAAIIKLLQNLPSKDAQNKFQSVTTINSFNSTDPKEILEWMKAQDGTQIINYLQQAKAQELDKAIEASDLRGSVVNALISQDMRALQAKKSLVEPIEIGLIIEAVAFVFDLIIKIVQAWPKKENKDQPKFANLNTDNTSVEQIYDFILKADDVDAVIDYLTQEHTQQRFARHDQEDKSPQAVIVNALVNQNADNIDKKLLRSMGANVELAKVIIEFITAIFPAIAKVIQLIVDAIKASKTPKPDFAAMRNDKEVLDSLNDRLHAAKEKFAEQKDTVATLAKGVNRIEATFVKSAAKVSRALGKAELAKEIVKEANSFEDQALRNKYLEQAHAHDVFATSKIGNFVNNRVSHVARLFTGAQDTVKAKTENAKGILAAAIEENSPKSRLSLT